MKAEQTPACYQSTIKKVLYELERENKAPDLEREREGFRTIYKSEKPIELFSLVFT